MFHLLIKPIDVTSQTHIPDRIVLLTSSAKCAHACERSHVRGTWPAWWRQPTHHSPWRPQYAAPKPSGCHDWTWQWSNTVKRHHRQSQIFAQHVLRKWENTKWLPRWAAGKPIERKTSHDSSSLTGFSSYLHFPGTEFVRTHTYTSMCVNEWETEILREPSWEIHYKASVHSARNLATHLCIGGSLSTDAMFVEFSFALSQWFGSISVTQTPHRI